MVFFRTFLEFDNVLWIIFCNFYLSDLPTSQSHKPGDFRRKPSKTWKFSKKTEDLLKKRLLFVFAAAETFFDKFIWLRNETENVNFSFWC